MKTRFICTVLMAVMLVPAAAAAANRHVRAGATGNNDGSDWNNAFTDLPANLVRGDTYYVADGTYSGRTLSTPANGTATITIKKATPGDHGSSSGWVDSYGDGEASFTSGFVFTSSYWVIDGQRGGGATNAWSQGFGFKITERRDGSALLSVGTSNQQNSASNITVRHVDLQGKGSVSTQGGSYSNDGLAVYGGSNVTLSYFRMQGIGRCPFFVSPKNLIVEHGWIQSYNGSSSVHSEVASIWGFSSAVGDVTFRYNLFTDIRSTGGLMWDNSSNSSARMSVYGNVFYKPPGATWDRANGVIGGWTSNSAFRNALVYNNSFVNIDQDSLSTLPQAFSGNAAYNNIFYNSMAPNFAKFGDHNSNHFIGSGGTQGESQGSTASGDPFVNIGALDFRLKTALPAGAGFQAPYNTDPYGLIRGSDGVADRGAYEFVSGGGIAPLPPLNLTVR